MTLENVCPNVQLMPSIRIYVALFIRLLDALKVDPKPTSSEQAIQPLFRGHPKSPVSLQLVSSHAFNV